MQPIAEKVLDTDLNIFEDIDPPWNGLWSPLTTLEDDDLGWMDLEPLAAPLVLSTSDVLGGLRQVDEVEGDRDIDDPNLGDDFDGMLQYCRMIFWTLEAI
jgi:hypothetical protein